MGKDELVYTMFIVFFLFFIIFSIANGSYMYEKGRLDQINGVNR